MKIAYVSRTADGFFRTLNFSKYHLLNSSDQAALAGITRSPIRMKARIRSNGYFPSVPIMCVK